MGAMGMVLGLLRRLLGRATVNRGVDSGKERVGPRGRFNGRCYEPAPEELEEAEPIPPMIDLDDPREVLSEEELGWPIVNMKVWKPRPIKGVVGYKLCSEVKLEGYNMPFAALVFIPDGKKYLIDYSYYALLYQIYQNRGEKTAEEIVEEEFEEFMKRAPDSFPIKAALLKSDEEKTEEDRELVHGFIGHYYAQLAVLKKYGLIE